MKREIAENSPVSSSPVKKPRITGFASTVTTGVSNGPVKVSTDLSLYDKSWVHIKVEDYSSVSCTTSKLPTTEAINIFKLREGEDIQAGISTELRLFTDPWKIKKILTQSDLGSLSRLIIGADLVENHILKSLPQEFYDKICSKEGVSVTVVDHDTGSTFRLTFKRWVSSRSYVLNGDWRRSFVKRRGLNKNDKIGLFWDSNKSEFGFSVLQRAL